MKLGIFDSGLGGILIAKAIHQTFPDLEKIYLGDTANLPYGTRSKEMIYNASRNSIDWLFQQGCQLIIVACNTASASALRRLQQEYLPKAYPDRRILGVIVPTIEEAIDKGYSKLGVIGTNYTIESGVYPEELGKIKPTLKIVQKRTPLLVPLIEQGGDAWIDSVLDAYLSFAHNTDLDAVLLGCTHYIHLKDKIRTMLDCDVISQDELISNKLSLYFKNHPYIIDKINKNNKFKFYVTDITTEYQSNACALFGANITVALAKGVHANA